MNGGRYILKSCITLTYPEIELFWNRTKKTVENGKQHKFSSNLMYECFLVFDFNRIKERGMGESL